MHLSMYRLYKLYPIFGHLDKSIKMINFAQTTHGNPYPSDPKGTLQKNTQKPPKVRSVLVSTLRIQVSMKNLKGSAAVSQWFLLGNNSSQEQAYA